MNLSEAIETHTAWRVRLRAAVHGADPLDVAEIVRDDRCALGTWLKGEGAQRFADTPEFRRALQQHQRFHLAAAEVAALINEGRREEAEARMAAGSDYAGASSDLHMALMALQRLESQAS